MKKLVIIFTLLMFSSMSRAELHEMYIGTFTGNHPDRGIYRCYLNSSTGEMTPPELVAEEREPIFLILNRHATHLYSTSCSDENNQVVAYAIHESGLTKINTQPSQGGAPCHVDLHPEERFLAVANYVKATTSIYPIHLDGSLGEASSTVQHHGSGPNPDRQQHPHAHSVNFSLNGKHLYVADLGIDRVMMYDVDQPSGELSAPTEIISPPGSGPRHLTFHPHHNTAYVIHELDSTLVVYDVDPDSGTFTEKQIVSTLPADFTGQNTCAEVIVHPNGKFLYASNRGHDSLAIFAIHSTAQLKFIEHATDGIDEPRHFNLDPSGTFCVVGNQDSDTLISFRVDQETGKLQSTGHRVPVEKPVCIQFASHPS